MPASTHAPRSHTYISVAILLWMGIGVMMYLLDATRSPEQVAALPEAQRALNEARPMWLMASYALATWVGLAGAIGLLMRKAWAVPLLLVSLVCVVVQFGAIVFLLGAVDKLGAAAALPLPIVIVGIGVASWAYASRAKRRGWLM
jgi:hypothetical protein